MLNLKELRAAQHVILNLTNLNVIVGRNGAGKSRFVRALDGYCRGKPDIFNAKYVSPERGGTLRQDPSFENNITQNSQYLFNVRNRNQDNSFKSGSAYLLKQLELAFLRNMERNEALRGDFSRNFSTEHLDRVNGLLTNITIEQSSNPGSPFIFRAQDGTAIEPDQISSGESEAVALAAEVMYFFATLATDKENILFLDEPDVHQHPDLQARFSRFLLRHLSDLPEEMLNRTYVIVATHSSPLICDLASSEFTSIGTKYFGSEEVNQRKVEDSLKKAAPFFAHPLSKSISDDPIFIVEGEDDERVWRQAVRSSQGRLKLYACLAQSVNQQSDLEKFTAQMLSSIYDNPVGFSVRDGDGKTGSLENEGPVLRFRLNCYAIENVLVTDECLAAMNSDWDGFTKRAAEWTAANHAHKDVQQVAALIASADRQRHIKIKDIRTLIPVILGVKKPWETVIGQTLGTYALATAAPPTELNISEFIGADLLKAVGF